MSPITLPPEIRHKLIATLALLPFIERIYLFGSRARGGAGERSDIDLAISCPKADVTEWQQVLDVVENAETLLKIDCVRLDTLADDTLRKAIERDKQLLYSKNHE